jgi:tRNA1(Val) A37 N6-methylase TrmN6
MRKSGIEPKELQLVTPHEGAPANIVLIHGVKNAGPELRLLPEIAVRTRDGSYTETIDRIYDRK